MFGGQLNPWKGLKDTQWCASAAWYLKNAFSVVALNFEMHLHIPYWMLSCCPKAHIHCNISDIHNCVSGDLLSILSMSNSAIITFVADCNLHLCSAYGKEHLFSATLHNMHSHIYHCLLLYLICAYSFICTNKCTWTYAHLYLYVCTHIQIMYICVTIHAHNKFYE